MTNPVNEVILKISGSATLPELLTNGKSYQLTILGAITGDAESANEDGTFNRHLRFRISEVKNIEVV